MVTKQYRYKGEERVAHFREMTVADSQKLLKGQVIGVGEDGKPTIQMDLAKEYERSLLLVTMTLVEEDGVTPVYGSAKPITKEPASLVATLIKLAKEAEAEHGDAVGN
jgi:hypothetical protein